MKLVTRQLDALVKNMETLAQGANIVPVDLSEESKNKLEWLRLSGRDFLAITPALQQACMRYARVTIQRAMMSGQVLTKQVLFEAMAEGFGKQVALRFESDGNDVSMIALAPSTIEAKARKGYSPHIGVATGDLKREMKTIVWKAK